MAEPSISPASDDAIDLFDYHQTQSLETKARRWRRESPVTRIGPGDVRVAMKFPLLRGRFALSGQILSSLPTARVGVLGGQGHWTFRPSVILAYSRSTLRLTSELEDEGVASFAKAYDGMIAAIAEKRARIAAD